MDAFTLASMAQILGASQVTTHGTKVQCTCLLAPWTHSGGRDTSPSMVIFVSGRHGDPIYSCLGCHEKGALRDLLCFLWMRTGYSTCHWIEVLDGEADPDAKPAIQARRRKLSELTYEQSRQKKVMSVVRQASPRGDGPWYDYQAVALADAVPEIPYEEYEPYAGSIPRYAVNRGWTVETCKAWELGHDPKMKRLLFPLRDRKGRLIAVSGRLYVTDCSFCGGPMLRPEKERPSCALCGRNEPPKYLHSKGFKRNLLLYGEHLKEGRHRVFVVEGHPDVISMWQSGFRPVVGLLGSSPGASQIEKLVAGYDKVITVGDGDKAGHEMNAKVREMIAGRIPVTTVTLPEKVDPDGLCQKDPALASVLFDGASDA